MGIMVAVLVVSIGGYGPQERFGMVRWHFNAVGGN